MALNHRQRRKWQPVISLSIGIAVVAIIIGATFWIWSLTIPPSTQEMEIPPLTSQEEELADELKKDVFALANDIGERNLHRRGSLDAASEWIEKRLREMGYRPERQKYTISQGMHSGRESENLIAEVRGSNDTDKVVIIGSHYDTVIHSPGANDNASAVAVLLSLAEAFKDHPQSYTVRFLFFANEEPPFFHTQDMGSYAYARAVSNMDDTIIGMIALDGLGFYSQEEGSQSYPVPGIGLAYPKKANFIGFVTRLSDRSFMNSALKAFRETASIPSEGAALPGFIPGVYWSDHWSFWQHDIKALLVTDTLLYRDPYYHTPDDTPERLDYEMMARVTVGLQSVVQNLASN